MSELAKATRIEEETKDSFRSIEVVKSIISEYKYLCKSFSKLSDTAEKEGDKTTVAFADDNVATLEKQLWMLGAMIK
jgi:starvation-inducible DNA-binding protein